MSLRVPMIRDEAIPIVPLRHCELPRYFGGRSNLFYFILSLRVIPKRRETKQSLPQLCHCEERSDEAISKMNFES